MRAGTVACEHRLHFGLGLEGPILHSLGRPDQEVSGLGHDGQFPWFFQTSPVDPLRQVDQLGGIHALRVGRADNGLQEPLAGDLPGLDGGLDAGAGLAPGRH